MSTHVEDRPTGLLHRRINRGDWPIGECSAFPMTPQMVHSVQLRGCRGQKPEGTVQGLRQPSACRSGMRGTPILKEDDGPAPPMGAHHRQEGLMCGVVPGLGDDQEPITTPDIERTMEHAPGMSARERHRDLLPPSPVTIIQGRRLGDDRFIEHQQDSAGTSSASPFAPPFSWRHVGERCASRGRGRFHRTSKRAKAQLPLCRETVRSCASRRYWVSRGAVQTVEREPNARGSWGRTASSKGSMRSGTVGGRPLRRLSARRSPSAAGRRARKCLTQL